MSTKYRLAEQIMSILRGGAPSVPVTIKLPEIMVLIGQVASKLLKTEFYTTHIAEERNVTGLVTAHYDAVPVEKHGKASRAKLPARPVKLIKNMGIVQVNKPGCRHDPFIPVPNGMSAFLCTEAIISDLFGQITYEHIGNYLEFNKDITRETDTVELQMVVSDIDSLGEHEPLPIPADMEPDIIQVCVSVLKGQALPDKHIDSNAEYKQARP